MAEWEYNVVVTHLATGLGVQPNINKVWEIPAQDGLTDWARIQKLGAEGWEMVSTFVLQGAGNVGSIAIQVVWVFKRAIS